MNIFKGLALVAVAGVCFTVAVPKASAQEVRLEVGVAPQCPYGYYDTTPYGCAPYGYYGSEWFSGGVFIGAGPWFHGSENFQGHVNNRYHPDHGYRGATPQRGEKPQPNHRVDNVSHFKGNEVRDGRGHSTGDGKKH